jgi:hypothetical protein
MKRRAFITSVLVTGLAGCSGGSEDIETSSATNTPTAEPTETATMTTIPTETYTASPTTTASPMSTDSPTSSASPTATRSPTPTATPSPTATATEATGAEIVIQSHELVTDDSGYSTEKYVAVTVENTGRSSSGKVTLEVEWYDDGENFLDSSTERLATLGGGETWKARVYKLTDASAVADYEISGSFETEPPNLPEDIELLGSTLHVEDDPAVTGRAENNSGEEVDYIEAIAKLYDSQGNVLASEFTNQNGVPESTVWKFSIEWFGFERTDTVKSHETLLNATVY